MKKFLPLFILFFCNTIIANAQVITTIGGMSQSGYSGDGNSANAAKLSQPYGVAVDLAGNVYIADAYNNVIRKVNTSGIISTIAGDGVAGYSGDGGPAAFSRLDNPSAIAIDASNNIYIADRYNQVIRKINTSGIISTIAGNNIEGYSGDGGLATSAKLSFPMGLTFDLSGNLFIADYGNNAIRKIDLSGIITTIAGTGAIGYSGNGGLATLAKLHYPSGVACDNLGNIYIGDYANNVVRVVNAAGIINNYAGNAIANYGGDGGPATSANLSLPWGLALDASRNLYIADAKNNVIRKVDTLGIITTFAGNGFAANSGSGGYDGDGGPATSAKMFLPTGIAVHSSGKAYIVDSKNSIIRRVSSLGIISTFAGSCTYGYSLDGIPATTSWLNSPAAVAVDASGNTYIADKDNNRIRKINTSGLISTYAGTGTSGFSGDGGPATSAELNTPWGIALDALGNMYIADANNNRIRKINSSGIISTIAGTGALSYSGDGGPAVNATMMFPVGIVSDALGNIFFTDAYNHVVRKINATTGVITKFAGTVGVPGFSGVGTAATSARLNYPIGLAVDGVGNVYIADQTNNRIRKVNTSGIITTFAGNGIPYSGDGSITGTTFGDGGLATSANVYQPHGVAVDASGNVYFTEKSFHKLRMVNASGIISRVAGLWYAPGYSGDGGVASAAKLNYPWGIAVDDYGTVYFADNLNNVVRKILFVTPVPDICMVTVDTLSTHNIIYWQAPTTSLIDSFIVYREDVTSVYTMIGSVGYSDASEFHDYGSDPNATTKRYKLAAKDASGTVSALSPYHNTIYIVDNGAGQFSWNPLYTIEGASNPVNNYILMRDDNSTGIWNQVAITAGTQNTIVDTDYSLFPNASYYVATLWNISCDPNRATVNTTRSNIKHSSLSTNVLSNSVSDNVVVFPNPANQSVQIKFEGSDGYIDIKIINMLGELVYQSMIDPASGSETIKEVNISEFSKGIYTVCIENGEDKLFKKLIVN